MAKFDAPNYGLSSIPVAPTDSIRNGSLVGDSVEDLAAVVF
jgi:hypothetical protein